MSEKSHLPSRVEFLAAVMLGDEFSSSDTTVQRLLREETLGAQTVFIFKN